MFKLGRKNIQVNKNISKFIFIYQFDELRYLYERATANKIAYLSVNRVRIIILYILNFYFFLFY